ncbi:response regulator [Arenibaculum pallidiluteum]|uniref:response regulator n=1 Tax=Arenibaculum pallidiluteum TaxID=2812559 RepID=UPI001A97AD77|nr:response regulator [Arenibaculum pallidiluteum]
MRILVVEDEAILAEVLSEMIEDLGHEVCAVVGTAAEALDLLGSSRPDALLVDVNLGRGGNGIAVASTAFERHGVRSFIMSGAVDSALVGETAAIRPFGFIAKPFEQAQLAQAIALAD